jgi:NAD(P)-dependent dehydrogenase (short-subunit alcohol dehydrogenase family)
MVSRCLSRSSRGYRASRFPFTEVLAQHPLGRVATPEEIAAAPTFCALDAPAVMTGGIIDLNGASYLRS